MNPKEAWEESSVLSLGDFIGEQDPNVAQYLNSPQNPLWVTEIEITDIDGAKLAIVENDPHYGAPCHIVRVDDGEYAQLAPGQIVGNIYEREINWKTYFCIEKWPEDRVIVDPETFEVLNLELSMMWKLRLKPLGQETSDRIKNLL